jgi:type I restriction-modification
MREMKDSGIEWIGQIPKGWELRRAKTLFTQRNSKGNGIEVLLSPTQKYGVVPQSQLEGVVQVKEDTDLQMFKTVHKGDFVISLRSFQGGFEYSLYEGVCSPAYQVFYPTSPICDTYYRYLFKSQSFISKMNNLTVGIREGKNIQYVDFANSQIPVPPLAEQERIAAFLDAECAEIDAVLEKTRASIEEYKKLKQAVITQAVTKGIRGDRPMKDSGIEWIGEIPAEWKVNLIKNVATTGSGGTPESGNPSLYDGDINWICSYDLKERPITKSERRLTQLGADSIAGNVQLKGSVLVAMYGGSGTIGNSGILECEAKTNQAICSIKFNNGYITDYFGFYYILSIRKYWMIFAVGTRKDPNISQDIVRKMPCILPPIAEQEEIVAYCNKACDQLDTLITKKRQYLIEIENYKKSLIYEYVTGKREA